MGDQCPKDKIKDNTLNYMKCCWIGLVKDAAANRLG
jgi:hypothetical protein